MNTPNDDGKPSVEEPLRFREVAFGTALLGFSAISIIAAVATIGTVTAAGDLLKKWGWR